VNARVLLASALLLAVAGCLGPGCAEGVAATSDGQAITVSWAAQEDALGYTVLRGVDGADPVPHARLPAGETTFRDADVTPDHTYTYRVSTEEDQAPDACPAVQARVADASVHFFGGGGIILAAAGAAVGALLILLRRR
ncbi:MAG TPA: fibronectin type III domain-containing protein, partial [Candidatus Thermoplasmatota archaeon]|nr:fibronectin type III domain-containing protein [Candidatus Thermoplasmatota archaeon]